MQKITKLVARQIGASQAAVGKSGFKSVAVFLVPEEVTLENMWEHTEVGREEFFGYVREWVITYTKMGYEVLCNRYNLTEVEQVKLEYPGGVPEEKLREFSANIRDFPDSRVPKMIRERAVSCIWRPEITFLPSFRFGNHRIGLDWTDIPGNLTVVSHIFGWDVIAIFGRGERYDFKNVPWGEVESKIENYFRFLKQIKGDEPENLTKTE